MDCGGDVVGGGRLVYSRLVGFRYDVGTAVSCPVFSRVGMGFEIGLGSRRLLVDSLLYLGTIAFYCWYDWYKIKYIWMWYIVPDTSTSFRFLPS